MLIGSLFIARQREMGLIRVQKNAQNFFDSNHLYATMEDNSVIPR